MKATSQPTNSKAFSFETLSSSSTWRTFSFSIFSASALTLIHTHTHTHTLSLSLSLYLPLYLYNHTLHWRPSGRINLSSHSLHYPYTTSTLPLHYFHIPSFFKVHTVHKAHKVHKENDGCATGTRRTRSTIVEKTKYGVRKRGYGYRRIRVQVLERKIGQKSIYMRVYINTPYRDFLSGKVSN